MSRRDTLGAGRRRLLGGLATLGAGLPLPALAHRHAALLARRDGPPAKRRVESPYGPVSPAIDETTGLVLVELPAGFRYRSFSWAGDPMDDGQPCPGNHDGMGIVGGDPDADEWLLVRNHERWSGPVFSAPATYDSGAMPEGVPLAASGGATSLRVRRGRLASARPSLAGTLINCAGGATAWGTWLSCEEIMLDAVSSTGRRHGYVFEVDPDPLRTSGKPIIGMGRFSHEAAAVDPLRGDVYLSEDAWESAASGFYRYLPHDRSGRRGSLEAGGRLQAARVRDRPNADLRAPATGERHRIEWIDIADPDADSRRLALEAGGESKRVSGPFAQAWAEGGLLLARGEGLCFGDGILMMADTAAGRDAAGAPGRGPGALWAFDPARDELVAVFAGQQALAGHHPDNLAFDPRGRLMFCEDGDGIDEDGRFGNRLMGVDAEGRSFVFARNAAVLDAGALAAAGKRCAPGDYRSAEFAGICFDPSGRWLFVNIYSPGLSLAITGPWHS
ncbi:MAG: alkaline phosphatase PhoX [Burkholderiaceae bacterium]